ncbi:MAG: hypothetical protein CR982_07815 [Candidatus Cloacimonadota bacterium]|nr:MAG: hypothetical protein CR982_07815 [Candidatus Cloacimonadota bacterium]PIE78238.1 MAG: hypothetical protein CSA15_08725 [Candidatus Delongbacteria bacterium]
MLKNIIFILVTFSLLFSSINIYSNPENIEGYKKFGLYPENQYQKKYLLNKKWEIKIGEKGKWMPVHIPSSFDNGNKNETVYYRSSFSLPNLNKNKHYKLLFYGINNSANIKINNNFVESHNSGFTSFEIDLNRNILNNNGSNEILIEVNNQLTAKSTIPLLMNVNGFKNYGGIYREVYLVETGIVSVSDSDINYKFTDSYKKAKIEITASIKDYNYINISELDSSEYKTDIFSFVEIVDKFDKSVYKSGESLFELLRHGEKNIKFKITLKKPNLWSPDNPYLYTVKIYTGTIEKGKRDTTSIYQYNFGLKSLVTSGGKLFLNGKQLFLQGVSRHNERLDMGNSLTYETVRYEVEKIKNMGSNIIHSNYVPPHPYYLDLCDKYGIFILQGIPIIGMPSDFSENKLLKELALSNLSEMINRDKHHPSIFAWGLGKQYNTFSLKSLDFIMDLKDLAKSLTPNIFTYIETKLTPLIEYYRVTDLTIIKLPDLGTDETIKKISNIAKDNIILVNNIGKEIKPGNEKGFLDPHSEPAQAKHIINNIKMIKKEESINGFIVDSFTDRISDVPLLIKYNTGNIYGINDGLVDFKEKNRISYIAAESMFKNRKAPTLNQGEYKHKKTNFFFILGITVTLTLLFLIKREHYLKNNIIRTFKNSSAFYIDIRDRRITQDWQSFVIALFSAIGISSTLSSMFFTYRFSSKFDYLLTLIFRNNVIKEFVIELIWRPYLFVIVGVVAYFILIFLVSIYIKFSGYIFKAKYSISNLFILISWSGAVYLIFLPFSALFIRIITPVTIIMIIITFMILAVLQWIRIIQVMVVIYKTSLRKVVLINLGSAIVLAFLFIYYLNYNYSAYSYLKYFFNVILKN